MASKSRIFFSAVYLATFAVFGFIGLALIYSTLPELPRRASQRLPPLTEWLLNPRLEEIGILREICLAYLASRPLTVLSLFCGGYIFLQSLAIPGAVILSALAGALYGPVAGLALVSVCATLGSFGCRLLYQWVGAPFVEGRLARLRDQVEVQRRDGNLFWFFLFLRVTPIIPNWLLNVVSAHVGIPSNIFLLGSLIGLLPNNILMVSLGAGVSSGLTGSFSEHAGPYRFLVMFGLGLLALLPIGLRRVVKLRVE